MAESEKQTQSYEPLIVNIGENPDPIKVVSLCVDCGKSGETVLLMTKIPFFKEMLISSFACNECGNKNNEVQFVGQLPPRGVSINFKVTQQEDLNREIVKSQYATIKFEQLGLEIPSSNRSDINTVEGILLKVQNDLSHAQDQRKQTEPETYRKVQDFIQKIRGYRQGKNLPFIINIYDPSGNSNVKNPFAPKLDDRIFISYFTRSVEQLKQMGYNQENIVPKEEEKQKIAEEDTIKKVDFTKPVQQEDFMHNEGSMLQILCHACSLPGLMRICQTNIPHFADLMIMSFTCDYCGAHSTQTKNSGVISDKSTIINLCVKCEVDLKRDLFKSETCRVKIPKIELELDYGTLGGVYTTVEGLLEKVKDHMRNLNPYTDSDDDFAVRMRNLIKSLQEMMTGSVQFQIIFEDPLSNSFLQNPHHPEPDKNALIIVRERNEQQKDYLGLNEMDV